LNKLASLTLAGVVGFCPFVVDAEAAGTKPGQVVAAPSGLPDGSAQGGQRVLDEACYGGEAWRPKTKESTDSEARRIRELKTWESFRDCPLCPEMKVIPPGEFEMGGPPRADGVKSDEAPRHHVAIRSFAISKYEVAWVEFERFVKATKRSTDGSCKVLGEGNAEMAEWTGLTWSLPGYVQRPDHPAVCVTWDDARAYADWLSAQTGKSYRLLSEAEWEYAARGRLTGSNYWQGQDRLGPCSHGNFADQTTHDNLVWKSSFQCSDRWWLPSPVGIYRPNRFGVYDMLGNLWEWVEDCHNPGYDTASGDGRPRTCGECERRIIRGASWSTKPANVRFGNRARAATSHRSVNVGIRIARDLE
jgi:formylglycine-generating enzyme required for sulfatase activity